MQGVQQIETSQALSTEPDDAKMAEISAYGCWRSLRGRLWNTMNSRRILYVFIDVILPFLQSLRLW